MTTPNEPDDGRDTAAGFGGNHSAPRPVPPLAPPPPPPASDESGSARSESTSGGSRDPEATSVNRPLDETSGERSDTSADRDGAPGASAAGTPSDSGTDSSAPTRVSAFPAGGRAPNTFPGSSGTSTSAPAGGSDNDRTRALPVTETPGTGGPRPESSSTEGSPGRTTVIPTGSRTSERSDTDATRRVPLADPDSLAGSTNGRLKSGARDPLPEEEWAEAPTKRTGAHIWGVLGLLVAVPVAWFLLTDGALRTYYGLPPEAALNPAGLLSLAGGLVTLVIIALVTRVTSLGAWIWGGVVTLAGLAALIFPVAVSDWLTSSRDAFLTLHEGFGTNVHDYLVDTSRSGLLLLFGLILLLLAFVSHGARRSGRYEGRIKAERESRGL